jgi:heme-degrading monooxygenase HmoA
MHIRLLTMEVDADGVALLEKQYGERIITALERTEGCRYAGLARSVTRPAHCLSITLWDTPDRAAEYERSGLFGNLLRESEIFFSPTVEYTIRLSEDLQVEYVPVPAEPVAASYPIAAQSDPGKEGGGLAGAVCLRVVSLEILPEKIDEFKSLYVRGSIPALRNAPGCRHVFLLENDRKKEEFFSVTVWESREHAEAFGRSDVVQTLVEAQKHTFTSHARGKLLAGADAPASRGSGGLAVELFTVLTGRKFG